MKKVIFDLDGTLFEAFITVKRAVEDTLKEFGLPMVEDAAISRAVGLTTENFLKEVFPEFKATEQFKQRIRYYEWEAIKDCGKVFDGIKELLHTLKEQEYEIHICSNGSKEYIELVVRYSNIQSYITGIWSSKLYSSKGEVIKQFVNKEDFAVVVGDTINDFKGAKDRKIPSIAAVYGYGGTEEYKMATFQAENPKEVLEYILLTELFHRITETLVLTRKCRIIGINGIDTSGKSMFTERYSRYLTAIDIDNTVLSIDDYHNPSKVRNQGKNVIDAYYENAYNYQQLIHHVLEPFKQQGHLNITVKCLNLDTDQYENLRNYQIGEDTILLVEGVLLFREPILPYLEGKIFLEIGFDEMLIRAEQRDVPKYGEEFLKKYHSKYIPVQQRYLQDCRPIDISDIVIDNTNYKKPVFSKIHD